MCIYTYILVKSNPLDVSVLLERPGALTPGGSWAPRAVVSVLEMMPYASLFGHICR